MDSHNKNLDLERRIKPIWGVFNAAPATITTDTHEDVCRRDNGFISASPVGQLF